MAPHKELCKPAQQSLLLRLSGGNSFALAPVARDSRAIGRTSWLISFPGCPESVAQPGGRRFNGHKSKEPRLHSVLGAAELFWGTNASAVKHKNGLAL
jgi:hypothetical protein